MNVRQHWAALAHPAAMMSLFLALGSWWALAHPAAVVGVLHLTRSSFLYPAVDAFYTYGRIVVYLFGCAAFLLTLGRFGTWSLTSFRIDAGTLVSRFGPFSESRVPLRAIQDVRVARSTLGLLLGFATVVVDAGIQEESLQFVPDPDGFLAALEISRA